MTVVNPAQFRLLLAGPKVSRLLPFFTARGYVADAAVSGEEALEHMRMAPRHVLLVELELEDMIVAELLEHVREENLAGAVILLEDPAKSGLIVATLLRGVDGYVATPPDEQYLFRLIERQLLAQWALAQEGQTQSDQRDKQRLEKTLQLERAKVTELVKEIASLREELHRARARAEPLVPSAHREIEEVLDDESGTFDPDLPADGDFSEQATQFRPQIPGFDDAAAEELAMQKTSPARQPAMMDDKTSPKGFNPLDAPFADMPHTRPMPAQGPEPAVSKPKQDAPVDDASESDLFLDLDEDTSELDLDGLRKAPKRP